jgi:hypothetical protein
MFKIQPLLLTALMGCGVAHAATETFTIDLSATSEAGRPVTGSLTLGLDDVVVTNDTATDGTLHQRTSGYNVFYANEGPTAPWFLNELGGESVSSISAWYLGPPDASFQVDAYLHTDGRSELKLSTVERTADHYGSTDASLSFTLACACSGLYSAAISAGTFAHYDEIRDGEAKRVDTLYYKANGMPEYLYDTDSVKVETQVLKFSTTAVPEPATGVLVLAGGLALWARRRLNARVVQ